MRSTPEQRPHHSQLEADPAGPTLRVYSFDGFTMTTSPLRLDRDGSRVNAQPQSLRVLERLLDNLGMVVSFDELLSGDDSQRRIRLAVAHLRRVLKDPAGSPRYIETVRSRGYRFVHPVAVVEQPLRFLPRESAEEADASVGKNASLAQVNKNREGILPK